MFSRRLGTHSGQNRISQAIGRRRESGAPILDLTESNPTAAGIEYEAELITAALGSAASLQYEPSPFGLSLAREAVAAYYNERGVSAPVERLVLTASTSEAYAYLFKLLCDPGDEVLVPRPSYPLFEYLAEAESASVAQYSLFYDHGWHLDLHDLASRITERTRAVILVNPNNPTGSYVKRGELDALAGLCEERDLAIISDEVFADYPLIGDETRVSHAFHGARALTFSLSGLSKVAGLPQLKLGWMAVGGPEALIFEALARLELIADTYLSVGTPVQVAAGALLEAGRAVRRQISERCRRNLAALGASVAGTGLRLLQVEGGWYATLQVPRVRSEEEWVLGLLDRGVLVQPGFFYDFSTEAFLVLSLLTPEPVFREGIERLNRFAAASVE